jgi:hypothetical protein
MLVIVIVIEEESITSMSTMESRAVSVAPGWNVEAVRKSNPKRARQTALRGRMIDCSSPSMLKFARLGRFVSATEY